MWDLDGDPQEYVNWQDTGCEMHPSCLSCPLPRCIEERPRGRQKQWLESRAAGMQSLAAAGRTVREIAAVYEVSRRTVQRELHRKTQEGKKGASNRGLPLSLEESNPMAKDGALQMGAEPLLRKPLSLERNGRAGSVEGLQALPTTNITPSLEGSNPMVNDGALQRGAELLLRKPPSLKGNGRPAGSVEGLQALPTTNIPPSLEGRGRG